ncbi:MAG TPA: 2Fe-2S iron-sulfur cluster-binding protein [Thermodesulfobacteriota bacterium]|nr:2Fe-2S iron-sulfur cluster-binding protein [Thermodesulfobacteriota bacterium]
MDKVVNIKINGRHIRARAGQTVMEAAKGAGIDIPSLCHHPAVTPLGACRICLVEIERQRGLQPACTFPVMEGMRVETESPKVVEERKFLLEMLFSEGNHYCPFCESSGDCELQALAYRYGLDHWIYPNPGAAKPVDGTREYFIMDHNRCILCRRCIRAFSELAANNTLGVKFRGAKSQICADGDVPFGDSTCVSCGTCLQICPTGALIDRQSAYAGREAQVERTKSVCMECSVGCGTEVVTRAGRILRVDGEWEEHNNGVLCYKGRFKPFKEDRQRINTPMVRKGSELAQVSWGEALDTLAQTFRDTPKEKIGAWATCRTLNLTLSEFVAVFMGKIKTENMGVLELTLARFNLPLGGSLNDLLSADTILVTGADPLNDHPVIAYHIKRACMKGARMLLVSDNHNSMGRFAHQTFGLEDMSKAVRVCQNSDSPVVLYGEETPPQQAEKLAVLQRKAHFIPLFPAANGFHAKALGLRANFAPSQMDTVYLLLEDTTLPADKVKQAREAKFLAVHASYQSPLTEMADVVLPSLLWYEHEGSLYNLEGKKVAVRKAVPLAEGIIPENEVLTQLAARV